MLSQHAKELSHIQEAQQQADNVKELFHIQQAQQQEYINDLPALNSSHTQFQASIRQLTSTLHLHARKATDIIATTTSITTLIQRTLDLRNAAALHTSNASLSRISASSAAESTAMLHLTTLSRHDARIMKVASIIALMYLPAGLVTSIFSTELVSLESVTLDIRKGVVIFVLLAFGLTAGTVAVAVLWIRRDGARAAVRKVMKGGSP
jgi:hypothetical protein